MKKFLFLSAALCVALASMPAHAQECNPLAGDCDDGGDGGDGGLGGVGGGPIKGGGTPTPPPAITPSATTTINFNTVGNVGQAISSYAEGGYNFQVTSGTIYAGNGAYGTRGIFVLGPEAAAYNPNGPANILSLTRSDGGLFSVDSFFNVLGGSDGVNTLTLTGYIAGLQVASVTDTSTSPGFAYAQPSGLTGAFDNVLFNFSTTSSSNSFDNLTVTSVLGSTVPEPATWAMMLVGFGFVGFAMRRRSKQAVRVTYA